VKSEIIPANQTIAKYFQDKILGKLEAWSTVMVRPCNIFRRKLSTILTRDFECRPWNCTVCPVWFHHMLYWVTSLLNIDPGACPEELASKQFFFLLFHINLMSSAVCIFLSSVSEIHFLMWHCTAKFPSCSLKHLEQQTNYQFMSQLEIWNLNIFNLLVPKVSYSCHALWCSKCQRTGISWQPTMGFIIQPHLHFSVLHITLGI
jgi:hypothetical protein